MARAVKSAHFNAWISALRSGKWRQGRNTLERVPCDGQAQFCCLGVLIRVDRWSGIKRFRVNLDDEIVEYQYRFDKMWSRPNESYCNAIGLPLKYRDILIEMNDNQDMDFGQIANFLESKKKELVDEVA